MGNETNASPTPWAARPPKPERFPAYRIADANGRTIASFPIMAEPGALEARDLAVLAVNERPALLARVAELEAGIAAVLERSGGRLYDTDQQTGETFDAMLRALLTRTGGGQ